MTQQLPPFEESAPSEHDPRRRSGLPRWAKGLAVAIAALVVAGSFVGVGMAVTSTPSASSSGGMMSGGTMSDGSMSDGTMSSPPSGARQGASGHHAISPARQAWAHKYGVDRATMPNLAPVSQATPQQQAAAQSLLTATEQATARYADLATAKAAGFDLQASLTKAEKRHPQLAKAIARVDAGTMPGHGMMPMLHVANTANRADGKVLDPNAPETLMYEYLGHGNWKLVGVMYVANESFPNAPPDPGGPIMRWHYHDNAGGQGLMMHLFFVPDPADLAHAYAAEMS